MQVVVPSVSRAVVLQGAASTTFVEISSEPTSSLSAGIQDRSQRDALGQAEAETGRIGKLCALVATTFLFLCWNSIFDSRAFLNKCKPTIPGRKGYFRKQDFEPGRPPDIARRPFQFLRGARMHAGNALPNYRKRPKRSGRRADTLPSTLTMRSNDKCPHPSDLKLFLTP
jgi:hypothetical protein